MWATMAIFLLEEDIEGAPGGADLAGNYSASRENDRNPTTPEGWSWRLPPTRATELTEEIWVRRG